MKIDQHYSISNDNYSWTLSWEIPTGRFVEATGKEIISRGNSHHGTLLQALKKYQDHSMKPAQSIDEVVQIIEAVGEKTSAIAKMLTEQFQS